MNRVSLLIGKAHVVRVRRKSGKGAEIWGCLLLKCILARPDWPSDSM